MKFYRLNPGKHVIRILTNPYQYYCHFGYIPTTNKIHSPKFVRCVDPFQNLSNCQICNSSSGNTRSRTYLFGVLNKMDNSPYLVSLSSVVVTLIKGLCDKSKIETPRDFNTTIIIDDRRFYAYRNNNYNTPADVEKNKYWGSYFERHKSELTRFCQPQNTEAKCIVDNGRYEFDSYQTTLPARIDM